MKTVAVIATGASLTPEAVASVRHMPCIVVSDAYELAPWAEALVSADKAWWKYKQPVFGGAKYALAEVPQVEKVVDLSMGSNSGLLACHVAVKYLGADRILLLGVDMHGSHYFGPHPAPLKNTQPHRFEQMKKQFKEWAYTYRKVQVWNCNPSSGLECFPKMSLEDALARLAESSPYAA